MDNGACHELGDELVDAGGVGAGGEGLVDAPCAVALAGQLEVAGAAADFQTVNAGGGADEEGAVAQHVGAGGEQIEERGLQAREAGVVRLADVEAIAQRGAAADEHAVGGLPGDDGDGGARVIQTVGGVGIFRAAGGEEDVAARQFLQGSQQARDGDGIGARGDWANQPPLLFIEPAFDAQVARLDEQAVHAGGVEAKCPARLFQAGAGGVFVAVPKDNQDAEEGGD